MFSSLCFGFQTLCGGGFTGLVEGVDGAGDGTGIDDADGILGLRSEEA